MSGFLFFICQRTLIFPEKTETQIFEMTNWIKNWNVKFGQYPTEVNEMIEITQLDKIGEMMLGIDLINLLYKKMEQDF